MLPKTKRGELKHRKRLREAEIKLAVETIARFFPSAAGRPRGELRILEFGSGDGFQLPYLRELGEVVGSDVYPSGDVRGVRDVRFVQCDVAEAPFADEGFDLIFSNHVIEHIEEVPRALEELKRIGRPECVYAFSVPTSLWLALAVPAQYYNKILILAQVLFGRRCSGDAPGQQSRVEPGGDSASHVRRGLLRRVLRFVCPGGHGVHEGFCGAFRAFRVRAWRRLFVENGFRIEAVRPLLLYGASEWPVVPTSRWPARWGACSSVLFLMKKREA